MTFLDRILSTMPRKIDIATSMDFRRAGIIITVDIGRLPDHILMELVLHGITQKVGDAAAGKSDTPEMAQAAMTAVLNRLYAGEWTGRSAGNPGEPSINRFIRAAMRTVPVIRTSLKTVPAEDRDDWLMTTFAAQKEAMQTTILNAANELAAQAERDAKHKAALAESIDITL